MSRPRSHPTKATHPGLALRKRLTDVPTLGEAELGEPAFEVIDDLTRIQSALPPFAKILAGMFPGQRPQQLRTPIMLALGRICHQRWYQLYERDNHNWPFPTEAQLDELRLVDWYLAVPYGGVVGQATATGIIERSWPEKKR